LGRRFGRHAGAAGRVAFRACAGSLAVRPCAGWLAFVVRAGGLSFLVRACRVAFRARDFWVAFRACANRVSFEALCGRRAGPFGQMRFGRPTGHRACVVRPRFAGRCAVDRRASIGRVFGPFL